MCLRIRTQNIRKSLNWSLILKSFGLFIAFISNVSSHQHQRNLYSKNDRYQNEYQRQPPLSELQYPNSYQQGGHGFASSNSNNYRQPQYQGIGRQQHSQRELNTRGGPNRPSQNSVMERNQHKCKFWIPTDVVDKYPWASKVTTDLKNGLQMIETCCEGYEPFRSRGSTFCRPVCENCLNGICISPGDCQCHEEFVKNDNGDCVFTCPMGCLNGQCYLDGTCQCDPGYKLDEARKFCRPICTGGCGLSERHNCTEPEVCGCSKGYRLNDTGCIPTCDPDCGTDGRCIEPNVCQCENGTTLKKGVCQEECYQKCDNGVCYGRNRCICNPGFIYHERSTQCVPI